MKVIQKESSKQSLNQGFDQVQWIDSHEHNYVDAAGQLNIFLRFRDHVVTPPLSGTILPGVTRECVLTLLDEWGLSSEERRVSMEEITEAIENESLLEAFGAGTAAVIAPIKTISYRSTNIEFPDLDKDSLAQRLYNELTGIQYGEIPDRHQWTVVVE